MPKFSRIQNNFLDGEISPNAYGRTDSPIYRRAVAAMENMITRKQGGVRRRGGTQYIIGTDGNAEARLIPFIVSETEAYICEITNGDVRMVNIDDLTTYGDWRDWTDIISSDGVEYVDAEATSLKRKGAWQTADLHELQYAQVVDLLYIAHPSYPPAVIQRTATNSFRWVPWWFILKTPSTLTKLGIGMPANGGADAFPFQDTNTDSSATITITGLTAVGSSVTLTLASNSTQSFTSGMVGTPVKFGSGGHAGVVIITGYSSSTSVTGVVSDALTGTAATTDYQFAQWNDDLGWPRTVAIKGNRVLFGGSTTFPDTLWGSELGDYKSFDQSPLSGAPADALKAINVTVLSNKLNQFQWMNPGKTLQLGTLGEEHTVIAPDATASLAGNNIDFEPNSSYGSRYVQSDKLQNALSFVGRNGRKIWEFVFDFAEQNYKALDLAKYVDHILEEDMSDRTSPNTPAFKRLVYQESEETLWLVDTNGFLYSCMRDREENAISWARHYIGGTSPDGGSASVIDICVLPSSDGNYDDLYLCIERTINSTTKFYIERINREFRETSMYDSSETSILKKPVFVDSSILIQLPDAVTEASASGLVTEGTDTINSTGHGLYDGLRVEYTTDDTAIGGLTDETTYYVVNSSANAFQLSETKGGTAIDLTDDGVGNHTWTPVASDTFEGLDHLEAESVTVLADGRYHANVTVSSGVITLSRFASEVIVGLSYTPLLEFLPLNTETMNNSDIGSVRRVNELLVHFVRTNGAKIGKDESNLININFQTPQPAMDQPIPLYTGIKRFSHNDGYTREGKAVITSDKPYPLNITYAVFKGNVND